MEAGTGFYSDGLCAPSMIRCIFIIRLDIGCYDEINQVQVNKHRVLMKYIVFCSGISSIKLV